MQNHLTYCEIYTKILIVIKSTSSAINNNLIFSNDKIKDCKLIYRKNRIQLDKLRINQPNKLILIKRNIHCLHLLSFEVKKLDTDLFLNSDEFSKFIVERYGRYNWFENEWHFWAGV